MTKHLWEADHSYYCNEGNFFSNTPVGAEYKSLEDFLSEFGDADFDMNLLFRFDWIEDEDRKNSTDSYYRNGKLKLFWMGQRKGLYRYDIVEVCRADESAVIEFLRPRWNHMKELWEPLA